MRDGAQKFLVVGVAFGKRKGERAEDEAFPAGRDVAAHVGERGYFALRGSTRQHKVRDGAHGEDVALHGGRSLDLLRGDIGVVGIAGSPDGGKPDVGKADERPAGIGAAALDDHDAVRVDAAVGKIRRGMRVGKRVRQLRKKIGDHVLFQKARGLVEIFLEVEAVAVVPAADLLVGRVFLDRVEIAVPDRSAGQLRDYRGMVEAFPFPRYRLGRFRVAPRAVDFKRGQFVSLYVLGDEHAAGSALA